jgi:hypothetical protein
MRAVKGSLGRFSKEKYKESEALARANGTSRRASGWADEKVAHSQGSVSSPSKEWNMNRLRQGAVD